jgi:hypothetical protein
MLGRRMRAILTTTTLLPLAVLASGCPASSASGEGANVPQAAPETAPEMQRPPPKTGTRSPSRTPPAGSAAPDPPAVMPRASGAAGCAASSAGKSYDVGDGKAFATIGAVPWASLQAGDVVRIHWRPRPYREQVLVSQSGSAKYPIRICGVPGPKGERPILDGEDATTAPSFDFVHPEGQRRALITVSIRRNGQSWGDKPRHIVIEGLELRGAASPNSFTNAAGERKTYLDHAACIFVERGEHIALVRNEVHGCGNGLFVASNDSEEVVSRDILIDGNHIWGNGAVTNPDRYHGIYSEAIGIVVQNNRFGPMREGSLGNQLKDRSTGTVVRYNWFEGGSRAIDLVEPEDSFAVVKRMPERHKTWVYGNVVILGARASSRPIHYGGDNGSENMYRKGTLFFYDNTMVISTSEKEQYYMAVLQLETDDESADVRNNLIYRSGSTHLSWLLEKGTARLGVNWISNGVTTAVDRGPTVRVTAKLEMLPDGKTITGDNPGFANPAASDYCLARTSPARNAAGALAPGLGPSLLPTSQYKKHQAVVHRSSERKDLGAFACE